MPPTSSDRQQQRPAIASDRQPSWPATLVRTDGGEGLGEKWRRVVMVMRRRMRRDKTKTTMISMLATALLPLLRWLGHLTLLFINFMNEIVLKLCHRALA